MFKDILQKCIRGEHLSETEAKSVMDEIMTGTATHSQIASLLTLLRFRGETLGEMVGFAKSMKEHAISIPHNEKGVIDTCGTGGDHAKTFNISTAAAIVLSSLGVTVAKHGNRSVSSNSGSADVLEHLNIEIQTTPEEAALVLEEKKMSFLFAPLYHVAMKNVATPRKELGFRSIFNLLGPLTNPANAEAQLIGVFDEKYGELMAQTLRELGVKRAMLVTGAEGLDEISIGTNTFVTELKHGEITKYILTPEEVSLPRGPLSDIQVKTPLESANMILNVFQNGKNEAARNIVAYNAGAGLYIAGKVPSIKDGVREAQKAIMNGTVYNQFTNLQAKKVERIDA
ncbi:anthranilate phosphoribosyltransferase [Alkalihalobacterium chitinilyticum]|uniref:Anthranilate phosphoribosyltransferase n=1 Tax=Alkalihalobacterium chitinilyticum TaxID=2980103 RepID=A0ABT5V8Z8_9BACI|nr:anthranilate phosphoribosyltransferase [Alkalihalobacterium chitinilyticum]MDE5411920.1 anthranilate phosphoribosyltransferase [Alkalihalobacterium chitinilyticum]